MKPRDVGRLLIAYAIVLVGFCIATWDYARVHDIAPAQQRIVETRWSGGRRIQRKIIEPGKSSGAAAPGPNVTIVDEVAVADGPTSLASWSFPLALVPGRDGLMAELRGRTAWVTVDDLLAAEAYDHASTFLDPSLGFGTHHATAMTLLADQLGTSPAEVEAKARVRRVRFERRVVGAAPAPRITGASLDRATVTEAVHDGAAYLARAVDDEGRFRYLVDAVTGQSLAGYSWPRHAGATYFLAQAAALVDDAQIRFACLRAASRLRDDMMKDCGQNRCIAPDLEADVGSSALALVAFVEIVRTKADDSYRPAIAQLARFLRAQQRPDGELMHIYDRAAQKPVDVQLLYYTGEASLALARAHRVTGDPEDLRAASAALSRLSGKGWSFFGSRYYFSEEHWTCQAVADLWDRAPDPEALAFCLRWHEYQRRLQHDDGDSAFDADGSFSFGPFVTPRTTPASSRGEAAGAALEVMMRDPKAGTSDPSDHARTIALLDDELRRAIAFVMRAQLRPGPQHLFARPTEVRGAMPGSAVDLQLRIDYVQHAGAMMIRWLELSAASAPSAPTWSP